MNSIDHNVSGWVVFPTWLLCWRRFNYEYKQVSLKCDSEKLIKKKKSNTLLQATYIPCYITKLFSRVHMFWTQTCVELKKNHYFGMWQVVTGFVLWGKPVAGGFRHKRNVWLSTHVHSYGNVLLGESFVLPIIAVIGQSFISWRSFLAD